MIRTQAWLDARPWRKEGLTRSAWLIRYRAAINMSLQSLGKTGVQGMSPAELLGHVRANSVTAPGAIFAHALRQSADHEEATTGPSPYTARLREAATLAEGGAEGVAPRPVPTARLRHAMEAVAPPPPTYTPLTEHELIHGPGTAP